MTQSFLLINGDEVSKHEGGLAVEEVQQWGVVQNCHTGQIIGSQKKLEGGSIYRLVEDDEYRDVCRICRGQEGHLMAPCSCSGSMQYAHRSCMLNWIMRQETTKCDVCRLDFKITRIYESGSPLIDDSQMLTLSTISTITNKALIRSCKSFCSSAVTYFRFFVLWGCIVPWLLHLVVVLVLEIDENIENKSICSVAAAIIMSELQSPLSSVIRSVMEGVAIFGIGIILLCGRIIWSNWCEEHWRQIPSLTQSRGQSEEALTELVQFRNGGTSDAEPIPYKYITTPDLNVVSILLRKFNKSNEDIESILSPINNSRKSLLLRSRAVVSDADDSDFPMVELTYVVTYQNKVSEMEKTISLKYPEVGIGDRPVPVENDEEYLSSETTAKPHSTERDLHLKYHISDQAISAAELSSAYQLLQNKAERGHTVLDPEGVPQRNVDLPETHLDGAAKLQSITRFKIKSENDQTPESQNLSQNYDLNDRALTLMLGGVCLPVIFVLAVQCFVVLCPPLMLKRLIYSIFDVNTYLATALPRNYVDHLKLIVFGHTKPSYTLYFLSHSFWVVVLYLFLVPVVCPLIVGLLGLLSPDGQVVPATGVKRTLTAYSLRLKHSIKSFLYSASRYKLLLQLTLCVCWYSVAIPLMMGKCLLVLSTGIITVEGDRAVPVRAAYDFRFSDFKIFEQHPPSPIFWYPPTTTSQIPDDKWNTFNGLYRVVDGAEKFYSENDMLPTSVIPVGGYAPQTITPQAPFEDSFGALEDFVVSVVNGASDLFSNYQGIEVGFTTIWFTGSVYLMCLLALLNSLTESVRTAALSAMFPILPLRETAGDNQNILLYSCNTNILKQFGNHVCLLVLCFISALGLVRAPLRVLIAAAPGLFPLKMIHMDPARLAGDLFLVNFAIVSCDKLQVISVTCRWFSKIIRLLIDFLQLRSFVFGSDTLDGENISATQRLEGGSVIHLPPQTDVRISLLLVSCWGLVSSFTTLCIGLPVLCGSGARYLGFEAINFVDCYLIGTCICTAAPYVAIQITESAKRAWQQQLSKTNAFDMRKITLPETSKTQPQQTDVSNQTGNKDHSDNAVVEKELNEGKGVEDNDNNQESVEQPAEESNTKTNISATETNIPTNGTSEVAKKSSLKEKSTAEVKSKVDPIRSDSKANEAAEREVPTASPSSTSSSGGIAMGNSSEHPTENSRPSPPSPPSRDGEPENETPLASKEPNSPPRKPNELQDAIASACNQIRSGNSIGDTSSNPTQNVISSNSKTDNNNLVKVDTKTEEPPKVLPQPQQPQQQVQYQRIAGDLQVGDNVRTLKKLEFKSGKSVDVGAVGLVRKVPGSRKSIASVRVNGVQFGVDPGDVERVAPIPQHQQQPQRPRIIPENYYTLLEQSVKDETKGRTMIDAYRRGLPMNKAVALTSTLLYGAGIIEAQFDAFGTLKSAKIKSYEEERRQLKNPDVEITPFEEEILSLLMTIVGDPTDVLDFEAAHMETPRNKLTVYTHIWAQVMNQQEIKSDRVKQRLASGKFGLLGVIFFGLWSTCSAIFPCVVLLFHWVMMWLVFGGVLPLMTGYLMELVGSLPSGVRADQCFRMNWISTYTIGLVYFELWVRCTVVTPSWFSYSWKQYWMRIGTDGLRGADSFAAIRDLGIPAFSFLSRILCFPHIIQKFVLPLLVPYIPILGFIHHYRICHATCLVIVILYKIHRILISAFQPVLGKLCRGAHDENYLLGLWIHEYNDKGK